MRVVLAVSALASSAYGSGATAPALVGSCGPGAVLAELGLEARLPPAGCAATGFPWTFDAFVRTNDAMGGAGRK